MSPLERVNISQLCYGPVVTYCMVYYYTKRATLARLLTNKGSAIYVVHLNRYFVIPLWYYLVVTFLWHNSTLNQTHSSTIALHPGTIMLPTFFPADIIWGIKKYTPISIWSSSSKMLQGGRRFRWGSWSRRRDRWFRRFRFISSYILSEIVSLEGSLHLLRPGKIVLSS